MKSPSALVALAWLVPCLGAAGFDGRAFLHRAEAGGRDAAHRATGGKPTAEIA